MVDTINPNITAGIGSGNNNPLQMLHTFAATQNALNQNALFQQTYRARQALGPLSQQAVGPDGQMDWNKYATLVSTHPDTAFMAPEILNQIAQKKLTDAETMNAELVGAQHRMDIIAPIMARAANDPKIQKGTDLVPYAQDIFAAGGIKDGNQRDMVNLLTHFAPLQGPELKQRLASFALANENGRKALSDINGAWDPKLFYNQNDNSFTGGWRSQVTGGLRPAPGPTAGGPDAAGLLTGEPSPIQTERLAEVPKYEAAVNNRAAQSRALLLQMDQVQDLLKNFDPSRAASIRAELGSIANAAGAPKELQDELANGDLSSSLAARKLFFGIGGGIAAHLLHDANTRGSQLLISRTLNEASPNMDMPAGAISKMMTAMREVANISKLEQSHFYARANKPGYKWTNIQRDWGDTLDAYMQNRPELP